MPQGTLYGVEHTFYSDAAYVVATQSSLHTYLRVVLDEDHVVPATRLQLAIFRHVLINRARVHTYDLQRELRRAVTSGELNAISSGGDGFRTPLAWTYAAFFECCIEWISSSARLRRRSLEDPYFAQLEQDLLYDVSSCWRQARELDFAEPALAPRLQTAAAADRPLLEAALNELLAYLREPGALIEQIQAELDMARIELFLCAGEAPSTDVEQRNARIEIAQVGWKGRDPKQLGVCFASRKYLVLRRVTSSQIRPLLDEEGTSWLVDPRGHSTSDASLKEADVERIDDLLKFRQQLEEQKLLEGQDFPSLWNFAVGVGTALDWTQLESAWRDRESMPGDPEVTETIERFADDAPATCQLIVLLLASMNVLNVILQARGTRVGGLDSSLELLARAILGTAIETRATSAAHLLDELTRLHGLELSERVSALVAELCKAPDARTVSWTLALNASDTVVAGTPKIDQEDVHARWLEHIAARMAAALDGEAAGSTVEEQGARLDVVAVLHDWFSPALLPLWRLFARPNDWTITMCSSLLVDSKRSVRPTPIWIRAFAAAKLGLRELAEGFLHDARAQLPTTSTKVGRICDHAGKLISLVTADAPRALLANPGKVLRAWRPIPGVTSLSISASNFAKVVADGHYDFIFAESDAPRPEGLLRDQFIRVQPATAERSTPPWFRDGDDTLVLHGPESLGQAIEWLKAARNPVT